MPGKRKNGKGRKAKGKKNVKKQQSAAAAKAAQPAVDVQKLPQKYKRMFDQVLNGYDKKDFKSGMKAANNILKAYPNNGETLAMKGLMLYKSDPPKGTTAKEQTAQAEALIKDGIRHNMKSGICWHVYGLFYRAQKKYGLAMSAYKNALRLKKNDLGIVKDLAYLQAHLHDYPGYLSSCGQVLAQKAERGSSWLMFIVAHYLNKNYNVALDALGSYRDTLDSKKLNSYDHSEICYFESEVLIAKGDLQGALEQLDRQKKYMRDQIRFRERKVFLLMKLGRYEDAAAVYISLFRLNPENYNTHRGYQCALLQNVDHLHTDGGLDLPILHITLSDEQRALLRDRYEFLRRHQPRCHAHQHVLLFLTTPEEFRDAISPHVVAAVRKAKPCQFETYRSLALAHAGGESATFETIATLLEEGIAHLDAGKTFTAEEVTDENAPAPTDLLFALLHLAQIRDAQGRHDAALVLLDRALEHTPTMVELYMAKAKVLKHAGDLRGAVDVIDYGRRLDLADRYVNARTTKYLLRANRCEQADEVINLFVKSDKEYSLTLFELQCMWYENEVGQAQLRRGNFAGALKAFMSTDVHFKDMLDDPFDFHSYSFRDGKCNLQTYLQMLRHYRELRTHRFFTNGALGLVSCYVALYKQQREATGTTPADEPNAGEKPEEKNSEEVDLSKMTAQERKKHKRMQRQKAAKEAKAAQSEGGASKRGEDEEMGGGRGGGRRNRRRSSPEPDGAALAKEKDPLAQAHVWVTELVDAHTNVDTLRSTVTAEQFVNVYLAQVEVSLLRGKFLLALQGLNRARAAHGSNARLAARIHVWHVRLLAAISAAGETVSPEVRELLTSAGGLDVLDAKTVAAKFLEAQAVDGADYDIVVFAAEAVLELDSGSVDAAQAITGGAKFSRVTPQTATRAYGLLVNAGDAQAARATEQQSFITTTFPLCKLHTQPLTANEPNEEVIGPVEVPKAPVQ